MSQGKQHKGLLTAAAHLAGHIAVGTFIFVAVALAAGLLEKLVHWLEDNHINATVIMILKVVEMFVFMLDISCYVVMLVVAAIQFFRAMWHEAKNG